LSVLDNALRAVGDQGAISVSAGVEKMFYVTRVGDSGAGVPAEIAHRIFEPFFTTRQAGEGTGLGLAIASQVLQSCGGSITVGESPLGGAEFTLKIPVCGPTD
jgi:two-component system NtrC family sensor kinase